MQKILITFATLPYAADLAEEMGSELVVVERHSHTHENTEKIVKAANNLNAAKIEITEVD